jgi:short-subunit dehydrogenase
MRELRGRTALVTGGSGGIGAHIARALAREGVDVAVSGRRADALDGVVSELEALGVKARALTADLTERAQADRLIERAQEALGPLDVLVNNAGVEQAASFTSYSGEELGSMVEVNLMAPLLLTRQALPGMLERGRGHVVFISSLAGKAGPAYQAPYAATKAALVATSQSLRAEHLHSPVGFSVVCPGFVAGDGMYQRMLEQGFASNRMMGATTIEKVAAQVIDAIRRDRAEVIESGRPIRPLLALAELAPGMLERTAERIGMTELFRRLADSREAAS